MEWYRFVRKLEMTVLFTVLVEPYETGAVTEIYTAPRLNKVTVRTGWLCAPGDFSLGFLIIYSVLIYQVYCGKAYASRFEDYGSNGHIR